MLCPVCNGMEQLTSACPRCGHPINDAGRWTDAFGPYAPYRPVDDLKRTDGEPDLLLNLCLHLVECANCGYHGRCTVQEITDPHQLS